MKKIINKLSMNGLKLYPYFYINSGAGNVWFLKGVAHSDSTLQFPSVLQNILASLSFVFLVVFSGFSGVEFSAI